MAQTASVTARKLAGFLAATDTGIGPATAQLAADSGIALAPIPPAHIVTQNMAFDLTERSQVVKYPAVYVYTNRVRNTLTEKFRNFSGKVRTVAEVRVSQDRLEGIEDH